jgi:hypothetical protein
MLRYGLSQYKPIGRAVLSYYTLDKPLTVDLDSFNLAKQYESTISSS